MFKLFFSMILCLFMFSTEVNAKYNPPKEVAVKTRSRVTTDKIFTQVNDTKDGEMTLEQWKSRKDTVYSRKQERKEMKDGTYKTPEQKFKEMDADKDGVVTKEEMETYIRKYREDGKQFY